MFFCFLLTGLAFFLLSPPPFWDFYAPYRLIVHLFGDLGCIPSLLFGTPQPAPQLTFLATVRDVTLNLLKCSHLLQTLQSTEEVIFINDRMDLAWIALCLLFNKKGAPLYISSVTVAFLSFNNARLFPWKFQVPWTGVFCIIMFLPNSDLCFPSLLTKGS